MDEEILLEVPIHGRKLTDSFGREWIINVKDARRLDGDVSVLQLEARGPETVPVTLEVSGDSLGSDRRAGQSDWILSNLRRYLEQSASDRPDAVRL
jgi:hypothetical protein